MTRSWSPALVGDNPPVVSWRSNAGAFIGRTEARGQVRWPPSPWTRRLTRLDDCADLCSRPRSGRLLPRRVHVGSAAATPTTPTAYVATGASVANPGDTVAVVDTVTSRVQKPITTGTLPSALAVTPDGKDVLVANKGVDTVSEIDVATGTVVRQATVGVEPDAVAVTPNGTLALVANFDDNTVTPLSLPSLRAGRPIAVGRQPVAIAVSPSGTLALVSDYEDGTVTPISLPGMVPRPGPDRNPSPSTSRRTGHRVGGGLPDDFGHAGRPRLHDAGSGHRRGWQPHRHRRGPSTRVRPT